ncbi:hypothetical protein [Streptomyces sp. NPDC088557]|uniref:hypothetical protein n=1 Tax=Streptomyces sp. NPDC088557 TaxID=3365867 RepID=UPI00381A0369
MAALMAAVEPARPVGATGAGARPDGDDPAAKADPDGAVDRSSPGFTSASVKAPEDLAGAGSDAAGARHKEGVIKTLLRAGATRWAKGGGTANKRLDVERARAGAHQVKETRTTTVMKSPGLPARDSSGGSGAGGRNSGGSSGGNSGRNSSSGNGSAATGRGGGGAAGGGGRGPSGAHGSGGSGGGRGTGGNTGTGPSKDTGSNSPKDSSSKAAKDSGGKGKDGLSGNAGAGGKAGKDGKPGASGSGSGSAPGGSSGGIPGASKDKADKGKGTGADLKKGGSGQSSGGSGPAGSAGKNGGAGSISGGAGKNGGGSSGSSGRGSNGADTRSPLQRSRETGHGDGSAVRNTVDHVKAYAKGAKEGYQDKREENGKEHARLDEAHAGHKAKKDSPKQQGTVVTAPDGRTVVIAPPERGDDGVSTDVKPLLVKEVDANTLTLGTDGARGSVSRKELRNFKQYERKLEAKETHLIKVAEACKSLEAAARDEERDCQQLAEQAKAVEGGEKLAAKLTKLADAAKAQAAEAGELHKRAKRAAEMCKVVLTNIATRYAPLYKAVVDSDETKPAELRFYNDKGSYAPAA